MALSLRYLTRAITGLFLLTATAALQAQVQPAAEPPPAHFRVITVAGVDRFFFDLEKKKETINAGAGSFSRLYPAPKNREVLFYHEVPDAVDPSRPPLKKPLARATLPAKKPGPFLILLSANPATAALPYNTLVIDHSLEAHPASSYRVFNLSKRRLAVNIADVKMLLESGRHDTAPYPATRKAWLQVAADEKADGWLLVSSSPHPVGPNSRTTVFLVDIAPSELDPDPKGIVARRISETIYTDDQGVSHIR
jgi:hypothetical protein